MNPKENTPNTQESRENNLAPGHETGDAGVHPFRRIGAQYGVSPEEVQAAIAEHDGDVAPQEMVALSGKEATLLERLSAIGEEGTSLEDDVAAASKVLKAMATDEGDTALIRAFDPGLTNLKLSVILEKIRAIQANEMTAPPSHIDSTIAGLLQRLYTKQQSERQMATAETGVQNSPEQAEMSERGFEDKIVELAKTTTGVNALATGATEILDQFSAHDPKRTLPTAGGGERTVDQVRSWLAELELGHNAYKNLQKLGNIPKLQPLVVALEQALAGEAETTAGDTVPESQPGGTVEVEEPGVEAKLQDGPNKTLSGGGPENMQENGAEIAKLELVAELNKRVSEATTMPELLTQAETLFTQYTEQHPDATFVNDGGREVSLKNVLGMIQEIKAGRIGNNISKIEFISDLKELGETLVKLQLESNRVTPVTPEQGVVDWQTRDVLEFMGDKSAEAIMRQIDNALERDSQGLGAHVSYTWVRSKLEQIAHSGEQLPPEKAAVLYGALKKYEWEPRLNQGPFFDAMRKLGQAMSK